MNSKKQLTAHSAQSGKEYIYFKVGHTQTVQSVIDWFHAQNNNTLWLWRGLTLLFMCVGFVCTSSIVTYIVSWIPLFGGLIGCGVHCAAALLGLVFYAVLFVIAYFSARKEIAVALVVALVTGMLFAQKSDVKDEYKEEDGRT